MHDPSGQAAEDLACPVDHLGRGAGQVRGGGQPLEGVTQVLCAEFLAQGVRDGRGAGRDGLDGPDAGDGGEAPGDFTLAVPALPDPWLAPLWLTLAQRYALRRSAALGLTPDNPFPDGTVNRVVRGVTLHR